MLSEIWRERKRNKWVEASDDLELGTRWGRGWARRGNNVNWVLRDNCIMCNAQSFGRTPAYFLLLFLVFFCRVQSISTPTRASDPYFSMEDNIRPRGRRKGWCKDDWQGRGDGGGQSDSHTRAWEIAMKTNGKPGNCVPSRTGIQSNITILL
jgi:hypothetical protein